MIIFHTYTFYVSYSHLLKGIREDFHFLKKRIRNRGFPVIFVVTLIKTLKLPNIKLQKTHSKEEISSLICRVIYLFPGEDGPHHKIPAIFQAQVIKVNCCEFSQRGPINFTESYICDILRTGLSIPDKPSRSWLQPIFIEIYFSSCLHLMHSI